MDNQEVEGAEEDTDKTQFSKFLNAIKRPIQDLFAVIEPPVWDERDEYDFSHESRGEMIIINNEYFRGHSPRPGSHVDAQALQKTFTYLGFDVTCHNNQTHEEMMKIFRKAAKRNHKNSDCFSCAVLSHGDEARVVNKKRPGYHEREDIVYAIDEMVLTSDIVELFTDMACPSLAGKPRLFFMQACRGNSLDPGVELSVAVDEMDAALNDTIEITPSPIYKDFLIMYATPPGYYAFRRPDTGSWFIRALCEILSAAGARNRSLIHLLTAVIQRASTFESKSTNIKITGKKQSPCFASMLTKDIYFKSKDQSTPV